MGTSSQKAKEVPRTTPSTLASLGIHLLGVGVLSNALLLLFSPGPFNEVIEKQVGGHFQFLTINGLLTAWLTMVIALLKDIIPSAEHVIPALDYAKNLLGTISVPIEGLISVLYWTLIFIDPQLLLPPDPRFVLPLFLDLSIHCLPAVFLWIDFLFFSPPFSKATNPALTALTIAVVYSSWMEYCASYNGHFPYPFFNDLEWWNRIAVYAGSAVVFIGLFHAVNAIHIQVDGVLGKDTEKAKQQAEGVKAE